MTKRVFAAALAVLSACADQAPAAAPPDAAAHRPAPPLLVTVTADRGLASLEVVNRGASPVVVASQSLEAAPLILEVRDARGRVVPTVPPPTPTGAVRTIFAGERLRRTLSLDVFSPPLTPGDYTVRAVGPDIESTVAPLHVER